MRPAGFEPATRGLEVRRFVYENAGSAACSSQLSGTNVRTSYLRIHVVCCLHRNRIGHSSMGDERSHGRVTQIGTEGGGLLLAPVSIPAQGLVLASAERADLLVDFSDLASGTDLTVWNSATAPFDARWSTSRPPAASTSTACCPTRRYSESASQRDAAPDTVCHGCSPSAFPGALFGEVRLGRRSRRVVRRR